MDISINIADGVPIYRQIANQIRYMIASSLLKPGEEILPIRALALQLKVTPNTVVKAYDELQRAGILQKRHGSGTFVSEGPSPLADRERNRIIEERVDVLLAEAHQLNFTADEVSAVFRRRQAALARGANVEKSDDRKYS